jgi:hypothetical protein
MPPSCRGASSRSFRALRLHDRRPARDSASPR